MLDAMRRSAKSFGMKIILMMIVLTFVFMGAGSFMSRTPEDEIASVNGEPVTVEEFRTTYSSIMENMRRQFGGSVDREFFEQMNLERQTLNTLIDQKLLMQVAREKSLHVPEEALIESISRIPAFQSEGRFDPRRYEMVLSQNRLTPQQFERQQKESILTRQIQNFIANTVSVSESEARAWFEWDNTEIDVEYVTFSPAALEEIEISDDEIKAYFEENKERYRTPPRIRARYVSFYPDQFDSAAGVSEEEIAAYYERNKSDYAREESVTASHILIRVPEDADADTDAEKQEEAREIYEKAKAGNDFAELAQQHSECPSSAEGGRLGRFSKDDMVSPFSEKAFSLEPGEIGEPVRTRFGWHIIRTEEHHPASVTPLESVADDIRQTLARQRTGDIAYERAMEMYDISFDGDDLVENAARFGYEVKTTGFFTRSEGPENFDNAKVFADTAFNLPLEQVSDIIDIDGGYHLIQPIERKEAELPGLEQIRSEVEKDVKRKKSTAAAENAARTFLETARESGSFIDAAREADRIIDSTGFFTRNEPVPGVGQAREFARAAFELDGINDIHDSVIHIGNQFFVIRMAGKMVPGEEEFAGEKDSVINRLASRKQQETFESWLENVRENSEIRISERFSQQFN